MNILTKCQQAEILTSMFIQELCEWENKSLQDSPNNSLMENFLNHLQELHHRELSLSNHESIQLLQLVTGRKRDVSRHPIPFPTGDFLEITTFYINCIYFLI
ncbi:hypothetical protein AAG570_013282 [Ranatra chinensis]|uniref:Uncharacterized protein n=1 Tax=Ranatra chinensis TaxID=642074 RepID=A0ABD0YGT2_9HEMI